jgi:toxin ParE1/3/4
VIALVIAPQAAFDIANTTASYRATEPGLGTAFVRHLDRTLANIQHFPEMAANVLPGFRRAIMHRFPFCVVYRIRGQEVEVIALFPTRADPHRLLARLAPLHTH